MNSLRCRLVSLTGSSGRRLCEATACDTTSQCGSGEVCASASLPGALLRRHLLRDRPQCGSCRPLPACGNRDDVRGWTTCNDPVRGQGEYACIGDARCQPGYTTDANNTCTNVAVDGRLATPAQGGVVTSSGCGGTRTFVGLPRQPAARRSLRRRSTSEAAAPTRSASSIGSGALSSLPRGRELRRRRPVRRLPSQDLHRLHHATAPARSTPTCSSPDRHRAGGQQRARRSSTPASAPALDDAVLRLLPEGLRLVLRAWTRRPASRTPSATRSAARATARPAPAARAAAAASSSASPTTACIAATATATAAAQRCSNDDDQCAPPVGSRRLPARAASAEQRPAGRRAARGAGAAPGCACPRAAPATARQRCIADPSCQPIYQSSSARPRRRRLRRLRAVHRRRRQLDRRTACRRLRRRLRADLHRCADANPGTVVDPTRSVLDARPAAHRRRRRSPSPTVMARDLGRGQIRRRSSTAGWSQLTADVTVDGQARPRLAPAPRRSSRRCRAAPTATSISRRSCFQATSLSNRIDLAGPHDCGEARITYALEGGVTDRRHRMTIIVELGQPDDGTRSAARWRRAGSRCRSSPARRCCRRRATSTGRSCASTGRIRCAPTSSSSGRTIGDGGAPDPNSAWELREWHLGADGGLHLSLLQAGGRSATLATSADFTTGRRPTRPRCSRGTARCPRAVPGGDLVGERLAHQPRCSRATARRLPTWSTALNQMACAGCHTTETNSAFAHVGGALRRASAAPRSRTSCASSSRSARSTCSRRPRSAHDAVARRRLHSGVH